MSVNQYQRVWLSEKELSWSARSRHTMIIRLSLPGLRPHPHWGFLGSPHNGLSHHRRGRDLVMLPDVGGMYMGFGPFFGACPE